MSLKIIKTILIAGILSVSSLADASLIIIGDVDAPNTAGRSENYDLLENIRDGGVDIAWLTGGYAVNSRYTDLRNRWTNVGATITDDLTQDISLSLANRDLVVVSQLWANNSQFNTTAMNSLANFLNTGGEVLYIAQVSNSTFETQYNSFLQGIGSNMAFDGGNISQSGEIVDTSNKYGNGVASFNLGGWSHITGGNNVVSIQGRSGVAFENFVAVPEPSTFAIFVLAMFGLASRRFKKQS